MTELAILIDYLEEIAPLSYQESYDNSGLIIGDKSSIINGVLVSLDVTEEVLDEAIRLGCNVVVSHHPLIFRGIKKISNRHYVDKSIIKAIKSDINIYAIHTNLDNVLKKGVNTKIAEKLGLNNIEILAPKNADEIEYPTIGSGAIGQLHVSMDEMEFLRYLKEHMQTALIRHTALLGRSVKKVALCGGSGSFLLQTAIRRGADIFISGDFKYHDFFEANHEIIIADIGHFESEQFTIELLYQLIIEKFTNFAAHYTKVNTNPIRYFN